MAVGLWPRLCSRVDLVTIDFVTRRVEEPITTSSTTRTQLHIRGTIGTPPLKRTQSSDRQDAVAHGGTPFRICREHPKVEVGRGHRAQARHSARVVMAFCAGALLTAGVLAGLLFE